MPADVSPRLLISFDSLHALVAGAALAVYADVACRGCLGLLTPKGFTGYPDGCTIADDDTIFIAFWNGGCVGRYNPNTGALIKRYVGDSSSVFKISMVRYELLAQGMACVLVTYSSLLLRPARLRLCCSFCCCVVVVALLLLLLLLVLLLLLLVLCMLCVVGISFGVCCCCVVFLIAAGASHRYMVPGATQVTSCAFGGPDLDQLYITTAAAGIAEDRLAPGADQENAGHLFRLDLSAEGVKGVPAFSYTM